uniref:Uncharacterized protein n=1 Tax=Meloidogyne enterolobii TaxID=390850 RepID=A0A6V7TZ63_MELEN|nr:unnamed protein product [Meloidogyne enterolobii]
MSTYSDARNIGGCSSSSQIQEEYIVVDDQHQHQQQQRNQRILISSKLEEAVGGEYGQLNYQQQYSDDFEICDEIVVDAEDGEDGRVLVSVPAGSSTYDNYGQFAEDVFLEEQIHGKSSVRSMSAKRVKKGLENKELFRVPIYKGNTKYGAGYDRLVNFDGSTTDHYICKNYDQCGKIFHRRYLDALTTHMQTCRNKNLINPEECNANACKALVARLVVQEPTALTLLTSRFYLEFMEELSRIIILRQGIGMPIGRDVLPRHRDLINELMRFLHEDEVTLLPSILHEMFQNGFALETLQMNLNDSSTGGCYKVLLATHISNSWELVRTVIKFYPISDTIITGDSCIKPLRQLVTQFVDKGKEKQKNLLEKFHIVSEFEQMEDEDDDAEENEKGLRHPCLLTLLDSVADRLFSEPLPIKSNDFDVKKLVKVRELLRSLREFAEQTRRYKDLRSLLSPRYTSINGNSRLLLMLQLSRRWVSSIENISKVLHQTKNSLIRALCAIHSDIFEEKNVTFLWSYVRVMEAFEMSIVDLETVSADKTPSSNLILFILLGLNKRLNVLKDSTKHLKNCDFETLKSLANFALNKLEKDFKTYIDKRMALCALYCDPMGLNHIGDLSDFCTMEEVKSVVLVELEHLLENSNLTTSQTSISLDGVITENNNKNGQQQNNSSSPWLSYTEEAQHYEQLTIEEIFETLEINGVAGIKRDPKKYNPLEFWNVYEEIYPSIARLAKKSFATNATLTGAEQISRQLAPLASSLSFQFKSGELISRMIRIHSIYKNKEKKDRHHSHNNHNNRNSLSSNKTTKLY